MSKLRLDPLTTLIFNIFWWKKCQTIGLKVFWVDLWNQNLFKINILCQKYLSQTYIIKGKWQEAWGFYCTYYCPIIKPKFVFDVFDFRFSLVSTYVVCERLSVMHEPAGVVEILVQILQNTPILKYSFRIPPPPKMKIVRDLGTLTFQFQNTPPPKLKFRQILALWLFSFRIFSPP